MYKTNTVSLVIPCHNEQDGLCKMLPFQPSFVDEIIVVDNVSTDRTADIARANGAIVVYEGRRGYGQACLTGIARSTGDILIVIDGDDSYPLPESEKLLKYMDEAQSDFVSGNRYPLVHPEIQPLINQAANRGISWLIRVLFQLNLKDSQSGLMVFNRILLHKIALHNIGMGFSQEIKIKSWTNPDICCGEVHISYGIRTGQVKFRRFRDSAHNLLSVIQLWNELRLKNRAPPNFAGNKSTH